MPRFRLIVLMLVVTWNVQAQQEEIPEVTTGKIERLANFSSKYVDARNIDIWLPEGYSKDKSYPVLYMHDGQMLYDASKSWNKQEWGVDDILGKLIADKKIEACIVVGIWNGGKSRHPDYFPQKPFKSLPKAYRKELLAMDRQKDHALFSTKVQSDKYLKFIVKELKPFIDQNYATKTDRANTYVAGSSMGGLISMYAICEYPKVFGGAACLSTHWPGIFTVENNPIPAAFMTYLSKHLPDPAQHKIYFDYGTATLDAMYEPFQLLADEEMRKKGYTTSNWITKKFDGANHSEDAWRARFDIPISFLMGQ